MVICMGVFVFIRSFVRAICWVLNPRLFGIINIKQQVAALHVSDESFENENNVRKKKDETERKSTHRTLE